MSTINNTRDDELANLSKRLEDVNKQIANIVKAIENGFYQESFKARVNELEDQKHSIDIMITQISFAKSNLEITEDTLRMLFSVFKQFVAERNIPECKKFIDKYVEKVLVFQDHVEIIFKVVFSFVQNTDNYSFGSTIKIKKLS